MNQMVINDEKNGISIDMKVSDDMPEGVAAKRFSEVLETVEYHRFQSRDHDE